MPRLKIPKRHHEGLKALRNATDRALAIVLRALQSAPPNLSQADLCRTAVAAAAASETTGATDIAAVAEIVIELHSVRSGLELSIDEAVEGIVEAMAASALQTSTTSTYLPRADGAPKPKRVWKLDALVDTCYSYRSDGPMLAERRARSES